MIPTEFKLIAVALLFAALGIGALELRSAERSIGAQACESRVAAANAAAAASAAAQDATWKEKLDAQDQAHKAQLALVQSRLAAAYQRLHVAAPSGGGLPQAASAPDGGGSGGGLSGSVGLDPVQQAQLEFEAARANTLRAGLAKCQAWAQTVTQ